MDSYLNPIIDVLPPKLKEPIKARKLENKDSMQDVAAQIVYISKHLSKVSSQRSCNLKMQCAGSDFGSKCILNRGELAKADKAAYEAIIGSLSSNGRSFADRCKVKKYLEQLSLLAADSSSQISDCEPSLDLLHPDYSMAAINKALFTAKENPAKC